MYMIFYFNYIIVNIGNKLMYFTNQKILLCYVIDKIFIILSICLYTQICVNRKELSMEVFRIFYFVSVLLSCMLLVSTQKKKSTINRIITRCRCGCFMHITRLSPSYLSMRAVMYSPFSFLWHSEDQQFFYFKSCRNISFTLVKIFWWKQFCRAYYNTFRSDVDITISIIFLERERSFR